MIHKIKITKLEQIQESVKRNYPLLTKKEQKRIIRQNFAYWLTRGRTLGSKVDPETGKRKFYIEGESIALLI